VNDDRIFKGMQLAAERPEVMPDEADERIQALYEDIKKALRVPIINLIFRTLANDPDYLTLAWERTAPVVRTRSFETAADAIRADALIEDPPGASAVDWDSTGPLEKIRDFNDTIHYVLPKLLLIVTAWDEGEWSGGDGDCSALPAGVAEGASTGSMVEMEDASDRVRSLLQREKEAHGHPLVSSYYRVLANWPDFLEPAWGRIEPLVGSERYCERKSRLMQLATDAVQRFPLVGAVPRETRTEDISSLLSAFRREFIPSMMLDVALIKTMLDGAAEARRSRFSAAS
jgi:hypothetical protein